jgi:hypothetical protein
VTERITIGDVGDAADRFGIDGADVWASICSGYIVTDETGTYLLHADPEKRQGTLWIVEAERV